MKKIFLVFVIVLVNVSIGCAQSVYDVNNDGKVNVLDATMVIERIHGRIEDSAAADTTNKVKATMIKCDKPTWKSVTSHYFSSMWMFVLDNSLPEGITIGNGDMIAAFMNGECRCAASPFQTDNGTWRYNITIMAKESDPEDSTIELHYYSAAQEAYCVSDPISYQDATILGSSLKGYAIPWK